MQVRDRTAIDTMRDPLVVVGHTFVEWQHDLLDSGTYSTGYFLGVSYKVELGHISILGQVTTNTKHQSYVNYTLRSNRLTGL